MLDTWENLIFYTHDQNSQKLWKSEQSLNQKVTARATMIKLSRWTEGDELGIINNFILIENTDVSQRFSLLR